MDLQDNSLLVPPLKMDLQVRNIHHNRQKHLIFPHYSVSGSDYVGVVDVPLMFAMGESRVCHDVEVIDDDECETPYEDFFSNLEYDSGDMPIIITRDRTQVKINDTAEPECGK